jgi:hypothetical protein
MMQEIYAQKVFGCVLCFFLFAAVASAQVATSVQENKKDVMVGSSLTKGFDMGVDSEKHVKKWVRKLPEYMEVAFPAYQEWAAVFITVGKPVDPPRNKWMDFSSYKTLSIEMRGEKGEELIEIGIKSNIQEDDGTETKVTVKLIPEWKTYSFPLDEFKGADLSHLYVVTELVYNGTTPQTMHFRNIKIVK